MLQFTLKYLGLQNYVHSTALMVSYAL